MSKFLKSLVLLCFLITVQTLGCIEKPLKKFFIKSVKVSEDIRIDWYVHSSISSFAPDYFQISTDDKKPFFVSFYVTDISYKNDTFFISLWKNNIKEFDRSLIKGIRVAIDTNGNQWNSATRRFGRLKKLGVNMEEPNFRDVSSPNGRSY